MPVDMFPARFFDELGRIKPFRRYGSIDPSIQHAPLPPKQAFLPGLFLFNHAAGYRLPEFEDFVRYYVHAVQRHKNNSKFANCFQADGQPKDGLWWRMSGWYDDSMAHAFLYSVLVLAFEDVGQSAFVLYDARSDWKFKADFVIVQSTTETNTTAVRVGIQGQNEEDRAKVEARRDTQERDMKRNTAVSSHWGNQTYHAMPFVTISRAHGDPIVHQNFRLFSVDAMEYLIAQVETTLGHRRRNRMTVTDMLVYRP